MAKNFQKDEPTAIKKSPSSFFKKGKSLSERGRFVDAVWYFNMANSPDISDQFYNAICLERGKAFIRLNLYHHGFIQLDEVLKMNPHCSEAYLERGKALIENWKYDEAVIDFDEALRINPDYSEAYLERGIAFYIKGEYEKSINDFSEAIKRDENNFVAFKFKGIVLQKKAESEHGYDRTENLDINLIVAIGLVKTGDYHQAFDYFDLALESNPDCSEIHVERGKAYYELENYDKAIYELNEAIALDNKNYNAFIFKGEILQKIAESSGYYDKIDNARTGSIISSVNTFWSGENEQSLLNKEGKELAGKGKYEEAIYLFDQVLQYYPTYDDSLYNKGKALLSLHKPEDALDCFYSILISDLTYEICYIIIKETIELGRYDEAFKILDLCESKFSKCWEINFLKGLILYKQGDYTRAIEQFDLEIKKIEEFLKLKREKEYPIVKSITISDQCWESYHYKGMALYNQGKHKQAHEQFIIYKKYSGRRDAILMIGEALCKQGKYREALFYYNCLKHFYKNQMEMSFCKSNDLKKTGERYQALEENIRAKELKAKLRDLYILRGEILFKMGRTEKAEYEFESSISLCWNSKKAIFRQAICFFRLESFDNAHMAFSFYLSLFTERELMNPKLCDPHFLYGCTFASIKEKNYEKAINHFNNAIKINSRKYYPYVAKGIILNRLERYEEAIEEFDNALERNSNLTSAYYNKYLALKSLNKIHDAVEALENVIRIDGKIYNIYKNRSYYKSLLYNDSFPFSTIHQYLAIDFEY